MLTSVDQEGTRKGLDLALIEAVAKVVPIPIIASGGVGSIDHMVEGYLHGADAIAIADMLHYNRATLPELRAAAIATEMGVRQDARVDS
jgi:cyclase